MLSLIIALAGSLGLAPAQAQDYPNRPITLVVPYAAGGGNDVMARIVGEKMSRTLGQQVVIDNRAGAGGALATRQVAKAPPDGYTLVIGGTGSLAINPTLLPNVGYDVRKDFTPICLIGVVPLVLVVPPSSPANSVAELIELAKSKPGGLDYGTAGNGSDNHLASELFNYQAGVKVSHVPYRGGGQVMTDLVAGRVAFVFSTLPTAIQSGRDAGMIPLERSLARLIDTGVVAPTVVKKIAADHDLLASLSGKLR